MENNRFNQEKGCCKNRQGNHNEEYDNMEDMDIFENMMEDDEMSDFD